MVIGQEFAWGHIGKTGGDAVAAMFHTIGNIAYLIDLPNDIHKHDTFQYRKIIKKIYALNIRRLPSWVISYYNHHFLSPKKIDTLSSPSVAPGNPQFLIPEDKILFQCRKKEKLELSKTTLPDRMLQIYIADYDIKWLRMETLREDFVNFVNKYIRELTAAEISRIMTLSTKMPNPYDHSIDNWFSVQQVEELYRNNPLWRSVEERNYLT